MMKVNDILPGQQKQDWELPLSKKVVVEISCNYISLLLLLHDNYATTAINSIITITIKQS